MSDDTEVEEPPVLGPVVGAKDIEDLARITYRRLDHWVTQGILVTVNDEAHPGQGQNRGFDLKQVLLARALVIAREHLTVANGGALTPALTAAIKALTIEQLTSTTTVRAGIYVDVVLKLSPQEAEIPLRQWLSRHYGQTSR